MTATPDRAAPPQIPCSGGVARTTPARPAEGPGRAGQTPATAAARGAAVAGTDRGPSGTGIPIPVPSLQPEGPRPNVLGLDLSLTGTGIRCTGCDTWTMYASKPQTNVFPRLRAIGDEAIYHVACVDLVVVEGLSFNSKGGQHLTRAGLWHLVMDRIDNAAPWTAVTPAALKKYATGKGNATKPDMRVALFKRTNIDERDDNKVDAWWLAAMGADWLGAPPVDLPAGHRAAMEKVAWPEVTP